MYKTVNPKDIESLLMAYVTVSYLYLLILYYFPYLEVPLHLRDTKRLRSGT